MNSSVFRPPRLTFGEEDFCQLIKCREWTLKPIIDSISEEIKRTHLFISCVTCRDCARKDQTNCVKSAPRDLILICRLCERVDNLYYVANWFMFFVNFGKNMYLLTWHTTFSPLLCTALFFASQVLFFVII